ncbi:MAG: ABC transporter permease, partial [Symbiobacteriaceae bacterium]|nr:ABC transporter permease [Symbiobacteriaceae bacterium]
AFLTNALSLSRGYNQLFNWQFRAMLGGEVAVFDTSFVGEIPAGESTWSYRKMHGSPFTILDTFFPELSSLGYLTEYPEPSSFSAQLQSAVAATPGIASLYPRYQIPGEISRGSYCVPTALRGRDFALDNELVAHPAGLVRSGRWLAAEDEGEFVAVVSNYATMPPGERTPRVGELVTVQVPLFSLQGDNLGMDYTKSKEFQFRVVGVLEIPTRSAQYTSSSGDGGVTDRSYPIYWSLDEMQIPLATWQKIWQEVAPFPYTPRELMLRVNDISYLEDTMLVLKGRFPELTFAHVPFLVEKALAELLIEDLSLAPEQVVGSLREASRETEQSVLPLDLRIPLAILIFCNAALVIASNLLIMIGERKTEIAILKAVGSLQWEIMIMVLTEAVLISGLGALGGFIFIRLPAALTQLTNRTSLAFLLVSIGRDFLMVALMAFGAAVVFGLMPAFRMARLTVNEVLRHE